MDIMDIDAPNDDSDRPIRAQRHDRIRQDRLSVDQAELKSRRDRGKDQQTFQLCEGLPETAASSIAKEDVAIGYASPLRFLGKSFWVESVRIRKPSGIAMHTPRTDEDPCSWGKHGP